MMLPPPLWLCRSYDNKKSAVCGIILDIGRDSTTAIFYEDDAIVHVRLLAFGGEHITAALAAELSVDNG